MIMDIKEILSKVEDGEMSIQEAELLLKKKPFVDIGYANIDTHRAIRNSVGEVIFGEGKSPDQIKGIVNTMMENGQKNILITRLSEDKAESLDLSEFEYHREGKIGIIGGIKEPDGKGRIAVVTAGTSDLLVANEAAYTAEFLGNEVIKINDVGVAGLHRLLARMDDLIGSRVVIAIAGMEGALASVIGGLVDHPVIAVPTSVGYGASFNGLSALLSMINSCANGISVVNIDNGYGAAYQASLINHL